jgi:hypothetical protein
MDPVELKIEVKRPPVEAALLRQPKLRTAVMSRAAATPNATAAARPCSSPLRLTVKPVTMIAKPAATAATWVAVEVISLAFWAFVLSAAARRFRLWI